MTLRKNVLLGYCCLLTCFAAAPLLAQSDDANRNTRNQRDEMRQRGQQNASDQQRQRDGQRNQQNVRLEPVGWVGVAYDYDNDGTYEGVEYISYYDLQRARENSQRRARQQANQTRQRSGDRQAMNRSGRPSSQASQGNRQQRQSRVSGQLISKGTTEVVMGQKNSHDQEMTYANLRTDSGRTVRAYVGSPDKVQQLDLQEGDQVTVEGVRAKINDKKVLLARTVKANGNSITNKMPRPEKWTRMQGEIRDVRNARGDGRSETHLVVELKCPDKSCTADLGPRAALSQADLQEGDRIKILARKGKIGGQELFIAQKIRVNDRTIDVRDETTKSLANSNQGRSQR